MNNHSPSSEHSSAKSAIPSIYNPLPRSPSASNTTGGAVAPEGSHSLPRLLALVQHHHSDSPHNPPHPHNTYNSHNNNQQILYNNQQLSYNNQQHQYNNQSNYQGNQQYNNQQYQHNSHNNNQSNNCHNSQSNQQYPHSDQVNNLYSSRSYSPSHNTSKSQTQDQWGVTSSNNDTLLSPLEPLLLTSLSQPASTHQGLAVEQASITHAPGLQSPAMTPNIASSALSSSTGTAEVLASAFSPLSSPSTATSHVIAPSLPSRTITKRPAEGRPVTRTVKRARFINDDEDEDDNDEENAWENDEEDNDGAEEEEEEELVEGMEGYEKKMKTRDDRKFADWIVGKLNEQGVYTALQARNTGTKKKTPKAEVNRRIMSAFNKHPPANIISFKKVTESQVKNRIDKIRKAFKSAHTLRNSTGFGSQNGEGWRKRVKKKCRHYFILERNWSKAWTQDVPLYADSLSNMDDTIIIDDLPRRLQKGKGPAVDLTRETSDNTLDLTQYDDNLLAERLYDEAEENLETYLRNRSTSPSATPGPSRSATPGLSRSTLAGIITAHNATTTTTEAPLTDSQSSSSKAANKNASKSSSGGVASKDFGQLFLKGLEEEQNTQREKITLKREQFEFHKKDMEDKNAIELKRIQLEEKRMEQEDKRMREQLKLDHDFRLAQLKYESDLQLKSMSVNAELRNRGREPVPATRIQTTPPPTTSPRRSPSKSPSRTPPNVLSKQPSE